MKIASQLDKLIVKHEQLPSDLLQVCGQTIKAAIFHAIIRKLVLLTHTDNYNEYDEIHVYPVSCNRNQNTLNTTLERTNPIIPVSVFLINT